MDAAVQVLLSLPKDPVEKTLQYLSQHPYDLIDSRRLVAYPLATDNDDDPLASRLSVVNPPVTSTPKTCFQYRIQPVGPTSVHTSAAQHHHHQHSRPLPHLWLRPRRHAEHQHLSQAPDIVGHSRRYRRRTRPPHLGGALAIGRLGNAQRLAQARMGQHKVGRDLEECQLLAPPGF